MADTTQLNLRVTTDTSELRGFQKQLQDAYNAAAGVGRGRSGADSAAGRLRAAADIAQKSVKRTGDQAVDVANAVKLNAATKAVENTARRTAEIYTTKINPALKRILNDTEAVKRQDISAGAAKAKDKLTAIASTIPQIPAALQKAHPAFVRIASDADALKKRLVESSQKVQLQSREVDRLRAAYDKQAQVALKSGSTKAYDELLKRQQALERGEKKLAEISATASSQASASIQKRTALEKQIIAELQKEGVYLDKSATASNNLRSKEQSRLLIEKAIADQTIKANQAAKDQALVDAYRRQAYALQIASTQLMNYGKQLTAFINNAVTSWSEIEYQALRASAALKSPVEMTNELTNAAMRAAEQMGYFSSADISKGLYFFASTTGATVQSVDQLNTAMKDFIPIMQAAAITSSDMETTIKGVYQIMAEFGMSMDNAAEVTQKLYYAAQNTAAELPNFVESLKMLGPVAAQMGVTFDQTMASLMTLADAGIKGTMAGRALRQMFLQLGDPSNRATVALDIFAKKVLGSKKSFKELVFPKGQFIGLKGYLDLMSSGMNKLDQASRTTLLGIIATAAETPALAQLIQKNADSIRNTGKSVIESNKGFEDQAKVQAFWADSVKKVGESTKAALGRISNSFENIKGKIGETLAPVFLKFAEAIAKVSEAFSNFVDKNPQLVRMIGTAVMIAGAFMTVAGAIGGVLASFILITKVAPRAIMNFLGGADALATQSGVAGKMFMGLGKIIPTIGGMITKLLGPLGRMGGILGGIFRFFGLGYQIVATFIAGFVSGFAEAAQATQGFGDVMGAVFAFIKGAVFVVAKAFEFLANVFNIIFQVGRLIGVIVAKAIGWIAEQVKKLIDSNPALKTFLDIMGGILKVAGDVIGTVVTAVGNTADWIGKQTDKMLNPSKEKLKEIDEKIKDLRKTSKEVYGSNKADVLEQIRVLELERQAILNVNSARQAGFDAMTKFINSPAGVAFRAGERAGLSKNWSGIPFNTKRDTGTSVDFTGGDTTGSTTKKTAQEKALELATQAANLAQALYKIEGIDLKALIKKTMGKLAEAMALAIKYAAPYAKKVSTKTAESVGQFAEAVGKVASAISGISDAAKKLETYKAPTAAMLRNVIADMSRAMKYMIAESKKFKGSEVAVVQLYADSAETVVGAIGAAVEAFNSMAKGVYQPTEATLRAVADSIAKAVKAFIAKVGAAPSETMLEKAKMFADAANASLGVIAAAVGAFKDLRNFVKPLPADLQNVVDTIELSIRKMIVSMGKFKLNSDQWAVVKQFGEVAKAIADAVGGTYDAYVKQMDFVDQFRTEIDYNKVFSWIEAGIKHMAAIAASMPVGMIDLANDAANAAKSIAEALDAFFNLAVNTGGDPALLADSLKTAVNSVMAIIETFAQQSQNLGADFVRSLITGMQSQEGALADEARRLTQIMGGGNVSYSSRNNQTITINHVISDPNGVLKNASAQEVAALLSGDQFISNLRHAAKTQ